MKKILFLVFLFLICFLFTGVQPQFAAVSSKKTYKKAHHSTVGKENVSGGKKLFPAKLNRQEVLWQPVKREALKGENRAQLSVSAQNYLIFQLNKTALTEILAAAPSESENTSEQNGLIQDNPVIIELPMPDGTFSRVRIEESSVLEPDLAAQFPEIKSYRGQGVDDPNLITRFDLTPQGFHALILAGEQTINVLPADQSDDSLYVTYYNSDVEDARVECLVKDFQNDKSEYFDQNAPIISAPQIAVGPTLRNYRIALAADFEYTQTYGGGTVSGTVASFNTWLSAANLIYERELSVRLNLINNTNIIYSADRGFTATTDPYDNSNVGTMLNNAIGAGGIDAVVGRANYDLGHVFGTFGGTGGSGVAYLGVVNQNSALKGGGASQLGGTVGNSTALGVWVHELGHQFNANHNFNGTQSGCGGGNRNAGTAYETGSGSTIMGYSGICGADNISNSRDMRFHAISYAAINNYINSSATNFTGVSTGNTAPTINGGGNFNIPKNTPFILTATANDVNGDSLTYTWDEIDSGGTAYPQDGTEASYTDANDPVNTTRPIFRSFMPSSSPSRIFPSLTYILNNANDAPNTNPTTGLKTAEELPRVGRLLNFRVMVRDNRPNGGGVNEDTVVLTVDNNSGPFLVTAPNTNLTLPGGLSQVVTWSVNNTNAAPINATNVKISLSTDGGNTFPTVLAASTANDGSEIVTLPNISTTTARLKVEAVGNVFFDISDTNFSITNSPVVINYEGDVSPRGGGDGRISSIDVSVIQGFQLGIGLPYQGNEFQRADTAPFSTRGDGRITSIDVSQAQGYQLGFNNPPQPAAGPTSPIGAGQSRFEFDTPLSFANSTESKSLAGVSAQREVRVAPTLTTAGQTVIVPIAVDAVGDESVYGFSLNYDSTKLSNPVVTIGNAGGAVLSNTTQSGQIGVSINYGGETIAAGNGKVLVYVQFTVSKNAAGQVPIALTDSLSFREVASAPGIKGGVQALATTFINGNLTINSTKRQRLVSAGESK